ELLALGVPEGKISYIGAMLDAAAIRVARQTLEENRRLCRDREEIPGTSPVVLSVGRLHRSKGHAYVMQAFPELLRASPDIHWVIVGDGPERLALKAAARYLEIEERVHMVGFLEDPLPWYAAADIYLRTGLMEADNLASFDAMGTGLPVVGFDTGSVTTE